MQEPSKACFQGFRDSREFGCDPLTCCLVQLEMRNSPKPWKVTFEGLCFVDFSDSHYTHAISCNLLRNPLRTETERTTPELLCPSLKRNEIMAT